MYYNITPVDLDGDWARVILFLGESGQLVQTSHSELLYVGGFMGNLYNFRIGVFKVEHLAFNYDRALECDPKSEKSVQQSLDLGRMGHLAFWDH